MPLFYHMERLYAPHKVRMSLTFMIKNTCCVSTTYSSLLKNPKVRWTVMMV